MINTHTGLVPGIDGFADFPFVKGRGGGQIFKMNICCSPGYGRPGAFYRIEKN